MRYEDGVDWLMFGEVMLVVVMLAIVGTFVASLVSWVWISRRRRIMWREYEASRREAEDWANHGQG